MAIIKKPLADRKVVMAGGKVVGIPTIDPFKEISREIKRRVTWVIQGDEKTGKTHLAMTAPDPIALININRGTEGVINRKEFKDKVVKEIKIRLPNHLIETKNEEIAKKC